MRGVRVYPSASEYGWVGVLAAAVLAFALIVLLSGCSISGSYVAADRATYNAIAPEYRAYVKADPTLSPAQKDTRESTVISWDARLTEGESE